MGTGAASLRSRGLGGHLAPHALLRKLSPVRDSPRSWSALVSLSYRGYDLGRTGDLPGFNGTLVPAELRSLVSVSPVFPGRVNWCWACCRVQLVPAAPACGPPVPVACLACFLRADDLAFCWCFHVGIPWLEQGVSWSQTRRVAAYPLSR